MSRVSLMPPLIEVLISHMVQPDNGTTTTTEAESEEDDAVSVRGFAKYKQLLSLPSVHLAALFIFTYVGVEVSLHCLPAQLPSRS